MAAFVALSPGCSDGPGRGTAAPGPASASGPASPAPDEPTTAAPTTGAPAPDTAPTATTAPVPPPTTTTTAPPDGSLIPGMAGDAVGALQTRLVALHYDPGPLDAHYGGALTSAVMAFEKVTGLPRTGRATPDVLAAVATAADPAPMLVEGGATRVEIDLKRQVLLYWRDGGLLRVLPVSTGSGRHYCEDGDCGVAVTPGGSFRVQRRIRGPHKSPLGLLYDPLFFVGGYAIHGSPSVPAYPASHGCVRIPMHVSGWFYDNVGNGTPVYVFGGRTAPTPFPPTPPPAPPTTEPAPPAPAPVETTTSRPPTTASSAPAPPPPSSEPPPS
ncbi:MAG TPA: L,D-transpeptidase family protein [Acidimicrobiia bacterium]|nr:L,D-transpeptidase family protein [Acidimicrobiia bacterium]